MPSSEAEKTKRAESGETDNDEEIMSMPERYRKLYGEGQNGELGGRGIVGNPQLVYESRLVKSFEPKGEPDGIEISKCIGVA